MWIIFNIEDLRPEERLKKLAHGLLRLLVHALQHHHHRLQGFNGDFSSVADLHSFDPDPAF